MRNVASTTHIFITVMCLLTLRVDCFKKMTFVSRSVSRGVGTSELYVSKESKSWSCPGGYQQCRVCETQDRPDFLSFFFLKWLYSWFSPRNHREYIEKQMTHDGYCYCTFCILPPNQSLHMHALVQVGHRDT